MLKLWRDAVSAGENCLSLEDLERFLEGAASDEKSAQHMAGCPHCQAELAMLRSFEASVPRNDVQAAVQGIADHLRRGQGVHQTPAGVGFWRPLLTVPHLAGVAALMLIGLGISLYVSNRQERPSLRIEPSGSQSMRSGDIRLAGPSGDLDQPPESFHWDAFPLAKNYSVQILEVDGAVLWRGETTENVLIANSEVKAKMRPGKTLLWKVTAMDSSGRAIAVSSPNSFRVTSTKRRLTSQ